MNTLGQIFMEFVGASWRVTGLILVLAAVRLFLRRFVPAGWLFAGWLVLAAALLVPMRLPVAWPAYELAKPARPAPTVTGFAATPVTAERGNRVQAAQISAVVGAAVPASSRVDFGVFGNGVRMSRDWVNDLALMWLAGIAVMLGLRLGALIRLRRKLAQTSGSADRALVDAVTRGCLEIGIKHPPIVLMTPLVRSPALCGLIRPRLLFPPGFGQRLGADELRFVVLHELGHFRRCDLWAQALLQAATTVHWFNPVVWLAVWQARLDCELACDEFVLRRGAAEEPLGYGHTLLKVLGGARDETRLPAVLGIAMGKRQLLTRITMIMDYRPPTVRRTFAGAVLLAVFAVAGYTEEAKPTPAFSPAETAALPRETRMQMMKERASVDRAARERQFLAWADAGKIVLRAIGAPGGVPVAVIDVDGEPKVVMEDSSLLAGRVSAIDGTSGRVTVRVGKNDSREFLLTQPRPVNSPKISPMQFEYLVTPAARRPDAENPVPSELVLAWRAINPEGKEAILMNYLRRGLVVDINSDASGASTSIARLFAKQISQRVQERREAFVASLTVEQRERFGGGAATLVRLDATPAESAAAVARAKFTKADQAKVIAELTSDQRKLYDLWQAAMAL